MFDRHTLFVNKQPQHINQDTRVTVNEHRAPTDQSVALLMEMEEKAWNKITSVFELQTIYGSANIFEYISPEFYGVIYGGQIDINGQKIDFVYKLSEAEKKRNSENQYMKLAVEGLIDAMSRAISEKILLNVVQTNPIFKRK